MTNPVNMPALPLGQRIHAAAEQLNAALPQTSLDVARQFGKPHQHVLAAIERLLPDLPPVQQGCFQPVIINDSAAYRLTRDGFTLLVLSFSGKRARAFKQAYVEAFNALEGALLHSTRTLPPVSEVSQDTGLDEAAQFFSQLHTAISHTLLKALINEAATGDKRWRKQRWLQQLVNTVAV